jgi:formate-dependent nitrite reductase membrane component NrfD
MLELRDAALNERLHLWAWPVALYLFLGGLAAGLLVFASWAYLSGARREHLRAARAASLLAPSILLVGLVVLWLDLGSKWTPFWLYLTFRPKSPMSWGAWILLATLLTSALAAVPALHSSSMPLTGGARAGVVRLARWVGPRLRALAWMNGALGVALGLYTGLLLGTMVARPALNSPVLAPLFLTSGLGTAAALLIVLAPDGPSGRWLARTEVMVGAIEFALLGLYLIGLATSTAPAQAAFHSIAAGRWAWAFWPIVVGAGLLLPCGVAFAETRAGRVHRAASRAAGTLAMVGGLTLRVVLVYAGQHGW